MSTKYIQITGIGVAVVYFVFIAFLYIAEPRSLADISAKAVTTVQDAMTKGSVIAGTYEIDRAKFNEALALFRADNLVAARDLFQKADPERRDAATQYYIAYTYYRQGWGRMTNDDELFAAAGLYVLMAFVFAYLYALIEHVQPRAFVINPANNPAGVVRLWDLLYFSFTCLTSVGFGEITPVNDHARSLVMIQQMVGVLYFALVVSRLVTLQTRRAAGDRMN